MMFVRLCRSLPRLISYYVVRFQHDLHHAARRLKPMSAIPGARAWPLIGSSVDAMRHGAFKGKMHEYVVKQHDRHGPIIRLNLGPTYDMISLQDPADMEVLLRNDATMPKRVPMTPSLLYYEQTGKQPGVFLSEGVAWQRLRKAASPHMLRPLNIANHTEKLNEVVDDVLGIMAHHTNDNTVQDFDNLLFTWALEAVCVVLFERRIGCLDEQPEMHSVEFIQSIKQLLKDFLVLFAISPKMASVLHLPIWKRFVKSWDVLFATGGQYIDDAILKAKASMETGGEVGGLIASMLNTGLITDKEILANVLDLMMAAIDTTSTTALWALNLLAHNPEAQQNLYSEICSVLPTDGRIQKQHVKELHYMKAVIKETLRLHPVVPFNSRILQNDLVIRDYLLIAGTSVLLSVVAQRHDANIFDDPRSFIPQRWLRTSKENSHKFASLNFGYGPRSCIGRRLAELDLQLLLSRLIQKYEIGTNNKALPDENSIFLLTPTDTNLTFTLRKPLSLS